MIQNIRSPQEPHVSQRQPENTVKPFGGGENKIKVDPRLFHSSAPPSKEQVEQAVVRVTEVLRGTTSRVEIDIDPDLHQAVIKILNGESGEIIRQIPTEELLELAKYLDEPKGMLVSERV